MAKLEKYKSLQEVKSYKKEITREEDTREFFLREAERKRREL